MYINIIEKEKRDLATYSNYQPALKKVRCLFYKKASPDMDMPIMINMWWYTLMKALLSLVTYLLLSLVAISI